MPISVRVSVFTPNTSDILCRRSIVWDGVC